jgi:sialic acid synthase SpsE
LDDEAHFELYRHAKSHGFEFVETLCAMGCLGMLRYFSPDKLKVASRDLTNLPLLAALAETRIPIILSTGMADQRDLDDALAVITRHHEDISILHCVSEYPTHPDHANLLTIRFLQRTYPQYTIGYSDHTIGISTPVAAVAMGARIIEKHVTIDRRMKGTDQAGSLGPDGVTRMVRDIRLLERSFGKDELFLEPSVASAKNKLERSVATRKNMKAGDVLNEDDIHLLSPGIGYLWAERDMIIGKVLVCDILANEIILNQHLVSNQ